MRTTENIMLMMAAVCLFTACGRGGKRTEQKDDARAPAAVECETIEERSFAPGDFVPEGFLCSYEEFFSVQPIPDDIFELMQGKTFKSDCTLKREDLRYILCLHKDIDGRSIVGEMVANKLVADRLRDIFLKLYEESYPIEKMRLPDYWDADDEMMMRDNNSSCFNFRTVPGTKKLSKHSLGMAVDINPLYNPFVRKGKDGSQLISPANGVQYADRSASFDYKIVRGDLCWKVFTERGFIWGGGWSTMKDYQHFEFKDAPAQ